MQIVGFCVQYLQAWELSAMQEESVTKISDGIHQCTVTFTWELRSSRHWSSCLTYVVKQPVHLAISIYRYNRKLGYIKWCHGQVCVFTSSHFPVSLFSSWAPRPPVVLSAAQDNPSLPTCLCLVFHLPSPTFIFSKHILSLYPYVTLSRMTSCYQNQNYVKNSISWRRWLVRVQMSKAR